MFLGLIKASSILKHGEKKGREQLHPPRRQQPPPCSKGCSDISAAPHEKLRQIPKTFFKKNPSELFLTTPTLLEAGKMELLHLHTLPQGPAHFLDTQGAGLVLEVTLPRQHFKHQCEDERQLYLLFNLCLSPDKKKQQV